MRFSPGFLLLPLLFLGNGPSQADDIPVAPLSSEELESGQTVYRITSPLLQCMVSPASGEIISLKTPGVAEWLAAPIRLSLWQNKSDELWEHRGWKNSEGGQVVMMTRSLRTPHPVRVVHLIELSPDGSRLLQTSRFHSTGPIPAAALSPQLIATLPVSANIWHYVGNKSADTCNGWILHSGESFPSDQLAIELGRDIAFISTRWMTDENENLLSASGNVAFTDDGKILTRAPKLPELPAQGWTLTHHLEIRLKSRPDKQSICDFLSEHPPAGSPQS